MPAFTPKKLTAAESWGDSLRQARRQKGLGIEDISHRLNIKGEYLAALEEERLDSLPAGLYGKSFLKKYAAFLKLDPKKMLSSMNRSNKGDIDPFSRKKLEKRNLIVMPKILRNLAIGLVLAVCCLYLTFYVHGIISAPKLEVDYPQGNMAITQNYLEISGKTEKEAEVKINGEVVLDNQEGNFRQTVNLKQGLNSLIIKAKKKYGRENTVTREILVQ